jgi:phosphatidylinositol-3-phosphatase
VRARCASVALARLAVLAAAACTLAAVALPATAAADVPHIKHLFVIVLENENAEETFGANPPSPYLGKTMREDGVFIPNYYGIGHQSLDNYIAMVSGQPPNLSTQADCLFYTDFLALTMREDGVAIGQGCVYPQSVQTVANQLENSGHSWRGYMQDMASSVAAGEPATCRHPALGSVDSAQSARAGDQYATRHDPFVYFHSIIDFATCQRNVVDLGQLPGDLASAATTPEYAFISPDLCADGHDATCADGTSPGGFAGIDAFLREWVPRIESSAGFRDDGALLVTFDESESGAEACCNEPTGPNTPNNGGSTSGSGGGRTGAVLVSPCTKPGTATQTAYNHYSFLRWTEDNFGLAHLAYAGTAGLTGFGTDVFSNPACDSVPSGGGGGGASAAEKAAARTRLIVKPRRVIAGRKRIFRFRLVSDVAECRAAAAVTLGGRQARTNRRGTARLKLRPTRTGKLVALARPRGCPQARATVRVVDRHTHRHP